MQIRNNETKRKNEQWRSSQKRDKWQSIYVNSKWWVLLWVEMVLVAFNRVSAVRKYVSEWNIWPILMNTHSTALHSNGCIQIVYAQKCMRPMHTSQMRTDSRAVLSGIVLVYTTRPEHDGEKIGKIEIPNVRKTSFSHGAHIERTKRQQRRERTRDRDTVFNYFGWTFIVCVHSLSIPRTLRQHGWAHSCGFRFQI